jgi:hypothetical protein
VPAAGGYATCTWNGSVTISPGGWYTMQASVSGGSSGSNYFAWQAGIWSDATYS